MLQSPSRRGIKDIAGPRSQAITARHAAEGFSLERYEFLGDAFLKYAASILVYQEHPKARLALILGYVMLVDG